MLVPNRYKSSPAYRYGFQAQEKDDELKGEGNSLNYTFRMHDPRVGRFFAIDPKATLLPFLSPYHFVLNSPIQTIDNEGEFPILINGKVGSDTERANSSYWSPKIFNAISKQTGYKLSDIHFVDGDKAFWPNDRKKLGIVKGKSDAQMIWNKLKQSINKEGKITEQLQVVTHSRGSAYGNGYMEGVTAEVLKLAEKEGIGFAYDKNSLVEYSVNLGPHQSNYIDYKENGTKNVNLSHDTDVLSGDDASGNVINITSQMYETNQESHGNATFERELNLILNVLMNNKVKSNLIKELSESYELYDDLKPRGQEKETVISKG